jgi:hypothetical protein
VVRAVPRTTIMRITTRKSLRNCSIKTMKKRMMPLMPRKPPIPMLRKANKKRRMRTTI